MKGLLEIIAALEGLREPAALATLVRAKGSSYRMPGARMIFSPGGLQTGLISAGCLETDVKARVDSVLVSREPQVAAFDMGSDLDLVWGTGMGCQGKADVLLECVVPGAPAPWMSLCAAMLKARRSGAMATVFGRRGEAGAALGQRFVLEQGGPGLMPAPGPFGDTLRAALDRALAKGVATALTCPAEAGEVDLLIEPILPPYALWIVGAGEHALPLARLAEGLGWYLGIVDHRPALATQARFPQADRIVVGHAPESLAGLPLDRRSAALVVSHVYEQDREALRALLSQPLGYLGLQGNRKRSARLLRELAEEGLELSAAQHAMLHVPAGLDLGAESPEAIALSMLAEVQAALTGHPGGSLRDRTGSIHQPPPGPTG